MNTPSGASSAAGGGGGNVVSVGVWNALENTFVGGSGSGGGEYLHNHLASALSTFGDGQYWEESISAQSIKQSLQTTNPTDTTSIPVLLKTMKWLLANISKGRNVSDFYVHVVKLVVCPNLEVRKLVYTYLIHYANYDAETRKLSLLSINSFQRGLVDREPLVRAWALRVLTSVQIPDILQIQILCLNKHSTTDTSPYVRKCAALAIAKLTPRCNTGGSNDNNNSQQKQLLLDLITQLLHYDNTTMVLSSALIALYEITDGGYESYLHILHGCFRKLCHLLTDMDEWGQMIAICLLTRYCRLYFEAPPVDGSAEQIDATRRVIRTLNTTTTTGTGSAGLPPTPPSVVPSLSATPSKAETAAAAGVQLPERQSQQQQYRRNIIKRRVVKKGFYSDEEDESTEEEVFADALVAAAATTQQQPQQPPLLTTVGSGIGGGGDPAATSNTIDQEEENLDPDHRLLLQSAMPLLKSRNAGVVLAVCSLQYYCGVSSIRVRKAMGRALVRIFRSNRQYPEIPNVVLQTIQCLSQECPSAFAPFLHDFFVLPDMDPHTTKLLKLDVLTFLALDPPSIHTVLKELRTYVQYTDQVDFCCASLRAVAQVTEMARICYDRHAGASRRQEADDIALNCLYGCWTLCNTTQNNVHEMIIGQAVMAMQRILQMLQSDGNIVSDPNQVQDKALRRILLLLVHTLSCVGEDDDENDETEDDDDEDGDEFSNTAVVLPPEATASALWLMGEYLSSPSSLAGKAKIRLELLRLLDRCYLLLEVPEREQAVHFASKLLVSKDLQSDPEQQIVPLCEHLLALGRLDVNPNVRDRARMESGLMDRSVGLVHDRDGLDATSADLVMSTTESSNSKQQQLSVEDAKQILLSTKPAPSNLPLRDEEKDEEENFRFGTLSSLVGHRARSAYLPLPKWAKENSPASLREPPTDKEKGKSVQNRRFYAASEASSSSEDDDSSTSSESSSSESSSDGGGSSSSSSDDSSSSDTESDSSGDDQQDVLSPGTSVSAPKSQSAFIGSLAQPPQTAPAPASSDENESSDESSSDSSTPPAKRLVPTGAPDTIGDLIPMGNGSTGLSGVPKPAAAPSVSNGSSSSVADDLKGLVLAPVVVDAAEPTDTNFDRDSGLWFQLVRPEHSRGLSVQARYLRGATKTKQAQLLGLTAEKPTLVCLQVQFENQRESSGGPFRHIRVLQRSSTASGSVIGPQKVALPQPIVQLATGQKSLCIVGIDFASASDRDGSLQAKLEIKFGSGGIPVELKPSIGELLLPCKRSIEEFDAAVGRMHGFNRVESKFPVTSSSRMELPRRLVARAALTPVGGGRELDWGTEDMLRLAGTLPASSDPVYVLATASQEGPGKLVVCCDHALVVNSVMNLLKRAIAEDSD